MFDLDGRCTLANSAVFIAVLNIVLSIFGVISSFCDLDSYFSLIVSKLFEEGNLLKFGIGR